MRKLGQGALRFFFPNISDSWLALLRWGLGLQLLFSCLSSRLDWALLYSHAGAGLIGRDLTETILSVESPLLPRLGWLVAIGEQFHLSESVILKLIWLFLLGAGLCLLLGAFSRTSAVLGWFLHLSTVKSGALTSYGMDNFTTIGLFYLMVAPLPDQFSLDSWLRHLPRARPNLHGFHRRILQIHLCLIYFFSGLTKACGPAWWNGDSVWRALTRAPFNILPPNIIAAWGPILPLLGIGVLLMETSYPVFIWWKRTRLIWLAGIIAMHLAIGLTMGLYLFGSIMIVLNLAGFAPEFGKRGPSRTS